MTITAVAIYEHGVLRLLSPLPLAEGARVEVTVKDDISSAPPTQAGGVIELLRQIAAMPVESEGEFSGRDHDRILYGASTPRP